MVRTTTPLAPSLATSRSIWLRASCRVWFTRSVYPPTSEFPLPHRVWLIVSQSSCLAPIEIPRARPAGTQPAMISLAKSWPDREDGNGRSRAAEPRPASRAAVPPAVADVVDGGAEHLADGLEPHGLDRRELVGRQRGTPGAAAPDLGHPRLGGRRQLLTGMAGMLLAPRTALSDGAGAAARHTG